MSELPACSQTHAAEVTQHPPYPTCNKGEGYTYKKYKKFSTARNTILKLFTKTNAQRATDYGVWNWNPANLQNSQVIALQLTSQAHSGGF